MDPKYFSHERREMLPFVPERRERVLEIGCSKGRFSAALTNVKETWGIEPSDAADTAAGCLTRVFKTTFEEAEADLPIKYFDLVICNDVIEHMPDHERFFSNIKKYIATDGMIIGSIPNVRYYKNMFQYLVEKDWHYTSSGILDRTHMAFFTHKSLKKTLEKHGFKVVKLQGINTDHRFSGTIRSRIYLSAAYALVAITIGYFSDIRHLQFAFQAIPIGLRSEVGNE